MKMKIEVSRRSFMMSALAAGAFPYIGCTSAPKCPDGKVRLACVGIGQQAWNDIKAFEATGLVTIAALCDTDLDGKQCAAALKKYPAAPRFRDFRKMLDAMDGKIDAVAEPLHDKLHIHIAYRPCRDEHAAVLGRVHDH